MPNAPPPFQPMPDALPPFQPRAAADDPPTLLDLHADLLHLILACLDSMADLAAAACTCKTLATAAADDALWRALEERRGWADPATLSRLGRAADRAAAIGCPAGSAFLESACEWDWLRAADLDSLPYCLDAVVPTGGGGGGAPAFGAVKLYRRRDVGAVAARCRRRGAGGAPHRRGGGEQAAAAAAGLVALREG